MKKVLLAVAVAFLLAAGAKGQTMGSVSEVCNTAQWSCGGGNVTNQPQGTALEISWFTGSVSADGIGKINLWHYTLDSNGAILNIVVQTLDADIEVTQSGLINGYPDYIVAGSFAGGQFSGTIVGHRACTAGRGAHCSVTNIFSGTLTLD